MSGSNMYLYDEYEPRKAVQSARNPARQRVLSEPDLRHSSMGNNDPSSGKKNVLLFFYVLIVGNHECFGYKISILEYDVTEMGTGKEPARVVIKGNKKVFFPPMHQKAFDPTPPDKRMQLSWVYPFTTTIYNLNHLIMLIMLINNFHFYFCKFAFSLTDLWHSYGYRGFDSKKNLWVLPTGELLYYVAAVAVLYDKDEEAQRHYTGHTEDIVW